jgi:hypothetical protein
VTLDQKPASFRGSAQSKVTLKMNADIILLAWCPHGLHAILPGSLALSWPRESTMGRSRRRPHADHLPTTVLLSVSPDLRSNGEVVELNVVPLDAGVLDQFKSKLA